MSLKRALTIVFLLSLVLATGSATLLHSMLYHETRRLNVIGNNTLLTLVFTIKNIGNYGYASVYLTYNGVYAYGLIILKGPGRNPEIYVMAGDQNHWLGPISNACIGEEITAYILILENKTLLYNICGKTGKYDLVYLPLLTTLHLVIGNVTGKASLTPKIIFNKIAIYVTNTSLSGKEIRKALLHGLPPQSMTIGLNMSSIPMTTTKPTTTASISISPPISNTFTSITKAATTTSSLRPAWAMRSPLVLAVGLIILTVIIVFLLRKKIISKKNV